MYSIGYDVGENYNFHWWIKRHNDLLLMFVFTPHLKILLLFLVLHYITNQQSELATQKRLSFHPVPIQSFSGVLTNLSKAIYLYTAFSIRNPIHYCYNFLISVQFEISFSLRWKPQCNSYLRPSHPCLMKPRGSYRCVLWAWTAIRTRKLTREGI